MAIPPVSLFANNPGGGLVTALGGINALKNAMAETKYNKAKADYSNLTIPSEAYSKLAYANAVAPQMLAKLLSNPGALANLSEAEKKNVLSLIYKAGQGQNNGLAGINNLNNLPQTTGTGQPSTNNFAGYIKNAFKTLIGQGQQNNPFDNLSQGMNAPNQMPLEPGTNVAPGKRPKNGVTLEGQQWYDKNGNPVYEEEIQQPGKPSMDLEVTEGQRGPSAPTYAENEAQYKGIVKEGEELGKIRPASIKELDQDYAQALSMKHPIDEIGKLIADPKFQKLRNLPGFQKLQLKGKATFGTPEEKEMIGKFQGLARQVVASTVKGFGGRILASEIPLSESMKLSENDSIESMFGKYPVIKSFNEMTLQRARIASKLMKKYHMDKGDALEQADEMVDGEAIRNKVEMELHPVSEEDILATMSAMNMTRKQVINRLKKEGRYNG